MLKTKSVVKYLEEQKTPVSFERIWEKLGDEIINSLGKKMPEEIVKSDLYLSLIEDERIIMVGGNEWALKENYSLDQIEALEKRIVTEEAEIDLGDDEVSDEIKELNLEIIEDEDDNILIDLDSSLDENDLE